MCHSIYKVTSVKYYSVMPLFFFASHPGLIFSLCSLVQLSRTRPISAVLEFYPLAQFVSHSSVYLKKKKKTQPTHTQPKAIQNTQYFWFPFWLIRFSV